MTGKELIYYILENDLLDEDVMKDGMPTFLMSDVEAAVKFDVGVSTVQAWATSGFFDYTYMDGHFYIYRNAKDPRK